MMQAKQAQVTIKRNELTTQQRNSQQNKLDSLQMTNSTQDKTISTRG